ncbi:hypothetical protein [Vibrio ouci]|uniref:Uncharacterized protein n=1 Tax=Vibrio ouci TaxID=2499078 RepID=A0A4Y8W809_9VIBR|nr:hypothetical protein [Vibrio ouci]TFH89050.1 hypothetical protein ELS82_24395 [Vibrio ouci]
MSKILIADTAIEGFDIILDKLTNNQWVKDIPVFGWGVRSLSIYRSIQDYYFAQKLELFLTSIDSLSGADLAKVRDFSKTEDAAKVSDKLLQVISSITDFEKSELLAALFIAYSTGRLDSREFMRSVDIINYTFIDDLSNYLALLQVSSCSYLELEDMGISTLINTSLLSADSVDVVQLSLSGREDEVHIVKYSQTQFGYKFRQACSFGRRIRATT